MTTYTDTELEGLMLLRQSFSWKVGVEQRAGVWFASYGGRRIRRDDPVSLFDALLLDAAARIGHHRNGSEQADAGQESVCTCCRELLGQMRSPAAPPLACYEGTFPGYTDQARTVRRELAGWLALEGCPPAVIDNAKLAASELAANAVLYSASRGTSFTVRCQIGSGYVRIEVKDMGGPWRPRKPDGRPHGLDLIEALAGSGNWGNEPTGDGHRIVWVRLPREQR